MRIDVKTQVKTQGNLGELFFRAVSQKSIFVWIDASTWIILFSQTVIQPDSEDSQAVKQSGSQTVIQSGRQTVRQSNSQTVRQSNSHTVRQ